MCHCATTRPRHVLPLQLHATARNAYNSCTFNISWIWKHLHPLCPVHCPATNYLERFSLASKNGHLIIVLILYVFPGSRWPTIQSSSPVFQHQFQAFLPRCSFPDHVRACGYEWSPFCRIFGLLILFSVLHRITLHCPRFKCPEWLELMGLKTRKLRTVPFF